MACLAGTLFFTQPSPTDAPPAPVHHSAQGEHGRGRAWNSGGGSRADAAVVRFASPLEARCAVRSLQQGHVSGSTVRLRVLE